MELKHNSTASTDTSSIKTFIHARLSVLLFICFEKLWCIWFYCLLFVCLFSSELYLKQCSEDLVTYSSHAGRKTIEIEDVILLLKRQRCINNTETFEYLVNTYLPLEYVEELLPCAVAGKKIVPSRLK